MKDLRLKFCLFVSAFISLGIAIGICVSAIYHFNDVENVRRSSHQFVDQITLSKDREIIRLEKIIDEVTQQNYELIDAFHIRFSQALKTMDIKQIKEIYRDIN